MKTKMKVAVGFGIGVGVGVGGTIVAQKCYEKYQRRLVEEFIEADIDDTVSGWDSEDDDDDFDDGGDGGLEETSEYPEEESAEEEDAPINITDDYVVPHPPIRLTCDRQDHDDDQLPEEETEETSSEEEVSEHADIINFVANGGAGDEKDSEDLSEDSPVETDDSKGSEPDDSVEPEESDKSGEFTPEFVEMVQNSMDRIEEINFLLDEKRYQEAKKLYRTTLVPLIANDAFREKYPDGTKVIESIGDKITDTICTARRAAKKKAKEEKAARRNANKYANQRRNSSSMVQPMKQYNRRAR